MQWIKSVAIMFFVNLLFVVMVSILLLIFNINLSPIGFALVFGFGGSFFFLYISKWSAKRLFRMEQVTVNDSGVKGQLWTITAEAARRAKLSMPELWIYVDNRPNAFATGPSRKNSMIAVSTGLLKIMDQTSLRGVIGHELGHIENGDMLSTTLLMGLMNSYVIWLGNLVGRRLGNNFIAKFIITIVAELGLSLLALIPISAFSRHREFAADAFSARIWGAHPMIKALQDLESSPIKVNPRKEALAMAYIHGGWGGLFATHPTIEKRINNLSQLTPKNFTQCSACGGKLNPGMNFCSACGKRL